MPSLAWISSSSPTVGLWIPLPLLTLQKLDSPPSGHLLKNIWLPLKMLSPSSLSQRWVECAITRFSSDRFRLASVWQGILALHSPQLELANKTYQTWHSIWSLSKGTDKLSFGECLKFLIILWCMNRLFCEQEASVGQFMNICQFRSLLCTSDGPDILAYPLHLYILYVGKRI